MYIYFIDTAESLKNPLKFGSSPICYSIKWESENRTIGRRN